MDFSSTTVSYTHLDVYKRQVPGKQSSPRLEERLNLRDILITMLMNFGGLRVSEPFHLFVHDVLPDPYHPDRAYVRVFLPEEGQPHPVWRDPRGRLFFTTWLCLRTRGGPGEKPPLCVGC